jgi:hypothetical protein
MSTIEEIEEAIEEVVSKVDAFTGEPNDEEKKKIHEAKERLRVAIDTKFGRGPLGFLCS